MKQSKSVQKRQKKQTPQTPSTLAQSFASKAEQNLKTRLQDTDSIFLNSLISDKSDPITQIYSNQAQLDQNVQKLQIYTKKKLQNLNIQLQQQTDQILDFTNLNHLTLLKQLENVKIDVKNFENSLSNEALRTIIDNLTSQLNSSNKRISALEDTVQQLSCKLEQGQLENGRIFILMNSINKRLAGVSLEVSGLREMSMSQARVCDIEEGEEEEIIFGEYD